MIDPAALELLRCPVCRAEGMTADARGVTCAGCGRLFDNHDYVDLLDTAGQGEPTATVAAQRLMESELVARIYERFWRPFFVRVFAGRGASGATGGFPGEFFIHKNALALDDRDGPWLDLSCGTGLYARAMAAAAPSEVVIGLDISRAMLEEASRRLGGYPNVLLVRGDAHALPFAGGRFGGVNNAGALHVYDDPEAAFREILRVLRPGGVYVGATFAKSSGVAGRVAARLAGIRRFDPPELRSWLERVGFSDYEELRLGEAFVFRTRKP